MPEQGEARGNPGGGSSRYWRANRSSDLGIGAKDYSNHLVAGSFRSFPQDSWSSIICSCIRSSEWCEVPECQALWPTLKLSIGTMGGMGLDCPTPLNASSLWAIFGKQNWRCGMNRTWGKGAKLLAHPRLRKGVGSCRQQDGGHGSRKPLRSV